MEKEQILTWFKNRRQHSKGHNQGRVGAQERAQAAPNAALVSRAADAASAASADDGNALLAADEPVAAAVTSPSLPSRVASSQLPEIDRAGDATEQETTTKHSKAHELDEFVAMDVQDHIGQRGMRSTDEHCLPKRFHCLDE